MKTFNDLKPGEFTFCTLSALQVTWSIILLYLMIMLNLVNLFKVLTGTNFKSFQYSNESINNCEAITTQETITRSFTLSEFTGYVYAEWTLISAVNLTWNIVLMLLNFELVAILFIMHSQSKESEEKFLYDFNQVSQGGFRQKELVLKRCLKVIAAVNVSLYGFLNILHRFIFKFKDFISYYLCIQGLIYVFIWSIFHFKMKNTQSYQFEKILREQSMLLVFSGLVICFHVYNSVNFYKILENFDVNSLFNHINGCQDRNGTQKNLYLIIYLLHRYLMLDIILLPLVIIYFKS